MWCNAGKPRQGQIVELYRQSKSRCKYAIRYIKRHENSLRKESLAWKLVDKKHMEFWKEVKHMNARNTPLPTCIDGISGADNIAQMWRDHYYDIFNSVNQPIDVVYTVDESTNFGDVVVPSEEVDRAVRELVVNKFCGIGLYRDVWIVAIASSTTSLATQTAAIMCSFSGATGTSRVRHNADYVPYAQIRFDL